MVDDSDFNNDNIGHQLNDDSDSLAKIGFWLNGHVDFY